MIKVKYEKYLPLGTIVILKNNSKKIMITGFTAIANKDENNIYDYTGCLYPEGYLAPDKMLFFNHQDIEKIYCVGYSDDEDKGYRLILKDIEKEIIQ